MMEPGSFVLTELRDVLRHLAFPGEEAAKVLHEPVGVLSVGLGHAERQLEVGAGEDRIIRIERGRGVVGGGPPRGS